MLAAVSWLSILGTMGVPDAISKRVSEGDDRAGDVAAAGVVVGGLIVGTGAGGYVLALSAQFRTTIRQNLPVLALCLPR